MNNTGVPQTMKFSGIGKTIFLKLNILSANHKINCIFGANSNFVAFKREKNLRYCFIRSKLNRDNNTVETPGTTRCHRLRCNIQDVESVAVTGRLNLLRCIL